MDTLGYLLMTYCYCISNRSDLFDSNKTPPRVWMSSLAPWLNCCTIPKTGVFAEEGPENYPPVSFCVWICWSTTPLPGGLNCGGGSFAQSQYPTAVYITFFLNDEIQKFFPSFDGTLSIQYHELRLINIVLVWSSTVLGARVGRTVDKRSPSSSVVGYMK